MIFEAHAEQQRHAHVDERPGRRRRGGDGQAMPALRIVADVGRRRIIHEIPVAVLKHVGRPEVLRVARPGRLLGKRVAEMLPVDEVE